MDYKTQFIELMLSSGVLMFGDFVTKSGRNTPYFVNTGKFRTGAQLSKLGDFYADSIVASGEQFDALFGPAYKGIPLCAAASTSLWRSYSRDVPYCFNRKEPKDHGEGGSVVAYQPQSGDRIAIIEDVTTAGTSVRETAELFRSLNLDVSITALYVTVDRMERGTGSRSAFDEIRGLLGINVYPVVTIRDITAYLAAEGKDTSAIEAYLAEFGAAG